MVQIVKPANPVARDMAYDRRKWANRVVLPKKGKGSYNRRTSSSSPKQRRGNVNIDMEV
jgi:hypothetical protein